MKIRSFYFPVVVSVFLFVFLASCEDKDKDAVFDITFDSDNISLAENQAYTVSILSGNGGYEIMQKGDENVAVSAIGNDKTSIIITAKADGVTTIGIKDAKDKTATIAISVGKLDVWKEYSGSCLMVDGNSVSDNLSVNIEKDGSDALAKMTLTNVIAGEPQLVINGASVTRDEGVYTIIGRSEGTNRDITVSGNIQNGKFTIDVDTKIKLKIVGDWSLRVKPDINAVDSAALVLDLKFGIGGEFIAAILKAQLEANNITGQALAGKIDFVKANFKESGRLDIQFKTAGEESMGISTAEFVDLRYFASDDNKVYLAIEDIYIHLLGGLLGEQFDISILTSLMDKVGNYYVLPLHTVFLEDNKVDFKVDKFFIARVLAVVDAMGIIPEEFAFLVGWLQDLAKLDYVVINLGLGFEK